MTDDERLRAVAALLGLDPEDRTIPTPGTAAAAYDDLPGADPGGVPATGATLDPEEEVDPYDAFVSTFPPVSEGGSAAGDAPLAGTEVAVKDNVAVAGAPLTAGVRAFADAVPAGHAPAVARLLDAGATVVGKTNMDALAYGPTGETGGFGPTRNPRDPDHVAGGSSAGSAAAVAADAVDAALGTDTGGSVRIPASFCGVVGYKPSFGAVPRAGVVPLAPSLDQVGVLAASVRDAARVGDAIAGPHPGDPATRGRTVEDLSGVAADPPTPADCSFGVAAEFLGDHVDAAVRARVDAAVEALAAAGADVDEVSVSRFDRTAPAWDAVANAEFAATLLAGFAPAGGVAVDGAWHDAVGDVRIDDLALGARVVENALDGAALLDRGGGEAYARALAECDRFRASYRAALSGRDALLAPTMPVTAPALGEWPLSAAERDAAGDADRPPLSVNVRQANLVGAPAVSIPCGRVDGLPVGLQLLGAPGGDASLLGAAAAVESVVGE